jgi:hypothetical protein
MADESRFAPGDLIRCKLKGQEHVVREIVRVRETGYEWKYPNIDKTFMSENSNDPMFYFWQLTK